MKEREKQKERQNYRLRARFAKVYHCLSKSVSQAHRAVLPNSWQGHNQLSYHWGSIPAGDWIWQLEP